MRKTSHKMRSITVSVDEDIKKQIHLRKRAEKTGLDMLHNRPNN